MRPIAIVGWLSILGALLARQGLGLVRGPEWPTLSDFLRESSPAPSPIARPGPCRRSGTCMTWRSTSIGPNERIVFQAGTHTVTMNVAYADFERLARPTVADIAMTR